MLVAAAVGGFAAPVAALDVPPLSGRVVDIAHLLPEPVAKTLSDDLAAHEARTGNQVALLTLPSLAGEPLEEFSHRVATAWKLGQKGTDNGVLMLVVPGERKIRIEVGYGLEGTLTDAKSSRIIRDEMAPRFRAGDFPGGIAAGVKAVLGTIEGTYTPPERVQRTTQTPRLDEFLTTGDWVVFALAVIIGIAAGAHIGPKKAGTWIGDAFGVLIASLVGLTAGLIVAFMAGVAVLILALFLWADDGETHGRGFGRTRGSGGFSGGGDFGGGFSGGGGSFGGGGASGGW